MATIGTLYPTLTDLAKQMDPNGKIARAINLMTQKNDFLKLLPMMEGNLPTGHMASVLTGLPTPAWRKLNAGTKPSTDSHVQIVETCGMLESWQRTDVKLAELSGNPGEFRMQKAKSHLEGITQEAAAAFFYADKSTPEKPLGLSTRFGALSGSDNARNVLNALGSGSDNTSIWLAGLGFETVCGIYPRGSTAGIRHTSQDNVIIQDAGGTTDALMEAHVDHWMWDFGIAVLDWRYLVRICNIDVSNLTSKVSAADLTELLMNAEELMPDGWSETTQPVIIMGRTAKRMLRVQRRDDVLAGGGLTTENVDGKPVTTFNGIRVITTDALLNTEAAVT